MKEYIRGDVVLKNINLVKEMLIELKEDEGEDKDIKERLIKISEPLDEIIKKVQQII